jgi:PPOX class probable F420-dependent enzyme
MDAATLAREKQISLTTFKRDGTPVSTPVWTVSDDGRRLLVWSAADTWKVKRIRRDPHVRVAGCDFHGKIHTDVLEGTARLLPASDGPLVDRLLRKKYPTKRPLDALNTIIRIARRRPKAASAYIEILLSD